MKKLAITLVIVASFLPAGACEICGCGVGNYYMGILPRFNHRFIGLRYHFNSFRTRLQDDPAQFSRDFYQTVEVWSGWNIGKRVQLLALVPYNFNHQVSDEGTSNRNGLGDVTVLANYKLLDIPPQGHASQQLWIGGGIKLPTGQFDIEEGDPDLAAVANTQRGSGSTDFLLTTMYNVQFSKWGINTNASYKINTGNRDEYKFGNKFSGSAFVYYASPKTTTVVSPNLGILYEHTAASELSTGKVNLTGGSLLLAAAGIEVSFKKTAVGFNTQLPVAQDFAGGQTRSKLKGMAHITFTF
jgi:hypothetical protein